ncbi:uncharacterized protein LOC117121903 [Anneissia japonica]|uniref:uncharacterized protein LOC117121903 n=1 Tax=Anneissia japonica TaxID=1529436 RepID=UPI001425736B|nr:uncharacterized protein LOC117121903 [Anneissia japonica]
MSGKLKQMKQRSSANSVDTGTLSINEKILMECYNLYTEPGKGLQTIAERLNLRLLVPRKKITVLLIGNHSAGKSSFINWKYSLNKGSAETDYFKELLPVIESVAKKRIFIPYFYLVLLGLSPVYISDMLNLCSMSCTRSLRSSTGREAIARNTNEQGSQTNEKAVQNFTYLLYLSVQGNATLHLYPHFKELAKIDGVVEYLNTEITTSKQKKFSLVTFVDTPGLVDGDMKYPFDVDKSILWLGNLADLIFVFFDPIGQALCKRTLNIVEKLNEKHSDRMRFFLSKADEAGPENDRQRVMMQIVQELCKRPGLNKTCFDMPTIYVPNPSATTKSRCVNQIEEVCKTIEKNINQTIQNTLNTLEKDCQQISDLIDESLNKDKLAHSYNLRARGKAFVFNLLGLCLPLILFINFLASSVSKDVIDSFLGENATDVIKLYLGPVERSWHLIPSDYHWYALGILFFMSFLLIIIANFSTRLRPTLSRKQKRVLNEEKEHVQKHVKATKEKLYSEYLRQSVAAQDL